MWSGGGGRRRKEGRKEEGRKQEGRKQEVQQKKQEPHTTMWGTKLNMGVHLFDPEGIHLISLQVFKRP